MTTNGRYVWLYAVAGTDAGIHPDTLTGVAGEMVRPVRAADLTAIVSDVAAPEFSESALRRNLADLRWLETTARAHHSVIETVARHGPVLPMRLATVYDSDSGLIGTLESRAADLHRALSRVRECHEWGVRGYVAEPAAGDPGPDEPGRPPSGPGAAYLRRRQAQLNAQEGRRREAMAGAQVVYAALSRFSVAARLYPPQSPELSGQTAPMILNAAYLVPDHRAVSFQQAVTALASQQPAIEFTVTGPWPAYSFVGEPDDTQPDGVDAQ